jgi:hypothetical protein
VDDETPEEQPQPLSDDVDPRLLRWLPTSPMEWLSLPLLLAVAAVAIVVGVLLIDSGHIALRQVGYLTSAGAGLVAAGVIGVFGKRAYDDFDERAALRSRNAVVASLFGLTIAVCLSGLLTRDRQLATVVNLAVYPLLFAGWRAVLKLGKQDPERARKLCRWVTLAASVALAVLVALALVPFLRIGASLSRELAWIGTNAAIALVGAEVTRHEIGRAQRHDSTNGDASRT